MDKMDFLVFEVREWNKKVVLSDWCILNIVLGNNKRGGWEGFKFRIIYY